MNAAGLLFRIRNFSPSDGARRAVMMLAATIAGVPLTITAVAMSGGYRQAGGVRYGRIILTALRRDFAS